MNARTHADEWLAAWNAHDLKAIMSSYADDVDFVASTVSRRWGKADGRLRGKIELQRHFQLGLQLASNLSFTEESLMTSPSGYALLYRRENGNLVIDVVDLNDNGLATVVRVFYQNHPQ